jgi:hypothetical protein
MDADAVFKNHVESLGYANLDEIEESQLAQLTLRFAIWPSVDTYRYAPWLAPFAIRKQRIRVEPHAPGPKRDLWGTPTEQGYFTDDNSLIKGFALRRRLSPVTCPYGKKSVTKGLVCCHIWSGSTGSPLLFSFTPNLVWLPKSLAKYSDAHLATEPHLVHHVLKQVSRRRYSLQHSNSRVQKSWILLDAPPQIELPEYSCTEIEDNGKIAALVINRINRMISFIEAVLDPGLTAPKRFSKRYHAGVGSGIDHSVNPVQDWLSEDTLRTLLNEMRECL